MKLTKVVIAMCLLGLVTVAGHVAVREWYKPDVRSERATQEQPRQPGSQARRDRGVSVRRKNAGTLIDFGIQDRQPLASPELFVGQTTPTGGKKNSWTPFLSALAGVVTGGILLALLFGWRRGRKPKAHLAADSGSRRGQLPLASQADLEKAEILRGRDQSSTADNASSRGRLPLASPADLKKAGFLGDRRNLK